MKKDNQSIKSQIEKEIKRLRDWLHIHSKDKDEGLVRNTELDLYYFESKLEGIKIGEQNCKEYMESSFKMGVIEGEQKAQVDNVFINHIQEHLDKGEITKEDLRRGK